VGEITNPHARESGLPVFLCRHPNEELAEFYQERVGLLKSRYR
jgi:hypothetical protein